MTARSTPPPREEDPSPQPQRRRTNSVRKVYQTDFANGSFRINSSITFELQEDIVFDPDPSMPALYDPWYPQGDGYFLGFFAAIVIEGDGITVDCRGHSIKMSKKFHKLQRFFSIIELGSRPFIPKAGPPPLANPRLSPGTLRLANNVVIKNCKLGRSSHHGIHGNGADGVLIQNTSIEDFEVGGISLNDCRKVRINHVQIGPSMRETFSGSLSQAIFLDHMANTIVMSDPVLGPFLNRTLFRLRHGWSSAGFVFSRLRRELNSFLTDGTGDIAHVVGKKALPDGSAIYGILAHKSGPAVGDFGACPLEEFLETNNSLIEDIKIENVLISGLVVEPQAWISLRQGRRQVQGPAGAVFRATQLNGSQGEYFGNPLSDAMIAVGHVLRKVTDTECNSTGYRHRVACERVHDYFKGAFIPKEILDWAASGHSKLDFSKFDLACQGDAMSHHNKGVVGLRLEYLQSPSFSNISIGNLRNAGGPPENESMCKAPGYIGNDVRAVKITNCRGLKNSEGKWPSQIIGSRNLSPGHKGVAKHVDTSETFF